LYILEKSMTTKLNQQFVLPAVYLVLTFGVLPLLFCGTILDSDKNKPFTLLSTELTMSDTATVGSRYVDTISVLETDNHRPSFALVDSQEGMTIADSIFSWVPNDEQLGEQHISVEIKDQYGHTKIFAWTISVSDTNHPPTILPTYTRLMDTARVGKKFYSILSVFDHDTDALALHILNPDSAPEVTFAESLSRYIADSTRTIIAQDTIIRWTPTIADTGMYRFFVRATDPEHAFDTVSLRVAVVDTNHWPSFVPERSSLPQSVFVGTVYTAIVFTRDHEGDSLTLTLHNSTDTVTMLDSLHERLWDSTYGHLQSDTILKHIFHETDTGMQEFTIAVSDPHETSDTLHWSVFVSDTNHWPSFVDSVCHLPDTGTVGSPYVAVVTVHDRDQDTLQYAFFDTDTRFLVYDTTVQQIQTALQSDTILKWTPSSLDIGQYDIALKVTDGEDTYDTITWSLTVVDTNHWPVILSDSLTLSDTAFVGYPYRGILISADWEGDSLHYEFIDSISGATLTDTLRVRRPNAVYGYRYIDTAFHYVGHINDTGTHTISVRLGDGHGVYDTVSWQLTVSDTNHWPEFITQTADMRDTISIDTTNQYSEYRDTLTVRDKENDPLTFSFVDSVQGMTMDDSILIWIPTPADTGVQTIRVAVFDSSGGSDTLMWTITVSYNANWSGTCPPYTHRFDGSLSGPESLPEGFFVYGVRKNNGIYKSSLSPFSPKLISNTISDVAVSLSLSPSGEWLVYIDKSRYVCNLIHISGRSKTTVPTQSSTTGYPSLCGFFYSSPAGTEIFYLADPHTVRAVSVKLEDTLPVFGPDRVIADLGTEGVFGYHEGLGMGVAEDGIFARVNPIVNDSTYNMTGFLTIPSGGTGTGTFDNVYQWENLALYNYNGCGHSISHDGALVVANAGEFGGWGCVPYSHNGFYISEFRHDSDPAIPIDHHLKYYGVSLNYVPSQYQSFSWNGTDFNEWSFSNDNNFVIGRLAGNDPVNHGAWVCEWKRNIWTSVTPLDTSIEAESPVLFFGNYIDSVVVPDSLQDTTDTSIVDPHDPHYEVLFPNGGETFIVGEVCSVTVSSVRDGNAYVKMLINDDERSIPGLNASLNPVGGTTLTFTMPSDFVSDNCRILIIDYSEWDYYDESDEVFRVIP